MVTKLQCSIGKEGIDKEGWPAGLGRGKTKLVLLSWAWQVPVLFCRA